MAINKKNKLPKKINMSRDELGNIIKSLGGKEGVEVGVYKGAYTKALLDAGLKVYGVDPWKAFKGQGRTQRVQDRQDFLYGHAQRYLKEYIDKGQCELVRKTSMEALDDFKDKSLDFVYIDGDHTFGHVGQDIYQWSKKVKTGGVVAGHDYFLTPVQARNVWCHVRVLVDAWVTLYDIRQWFLIGNTMTLETMKHEADRGDLYWSWFWLNPELVI